MVRDSLLTVQRSFDVWIGCIVAVFVRELHERVNRTGSNLIAILEPIGLILMLSGGHYFLGATRSMYGSSSILFFTTGILPHYIFIWVSARVSALHLNHVPFPNVNILDIVIAIAAIEIMTLFGTMILIFGGLWFWDVPEARPYDIFGILTVTLTLGAFGIGIGLINAVVATFVPIWRSSYHIIVRGAMLISGLFFIPDFMLPWARASLAWNPLLHGVGWFRLSVYPAYPSLILDKGFLLSTTILSLVIGLALERVLRRRRTLQ